jgi:uncharacterized protein (DUF2147 family)
MAATTRSHAKPARKFVRMAVYSGLILAGGLAPALALDPTGDWRVADGVANIRVAECNGGMWGAVSWEQTPGGRDTHNPDVSKQNRPTLGMPILIDMKKKKPNADQWEGQVYNAKDGKFYNSTIKPVDADHLQIQGCVLGFLCGGETWTRVAGPIPSTLANSMARTPGKMSATPPKTAAPKSAAPNDAAAPNSTSPPKTAGSVTASSKKATASASAPEAVGDICLLPEVMGSAR